MRTLKTGVSLWHLLLLLIMWSPVIIVIANGGEPFNLRISCGSTQDVHIPPSNIQWSKDIGYTGGGTATATQTTSIVPQLTTLRYFPLSDGSENCYQINNIPQGHYQVRFFLAVQKGSVPDNEPLFDISVEGTQIYSMKSGWSMVEDQTFVEALVFVRGSSILSCFHAIGRGDPSILSLEILQITDTAYNISRGIGQATLIRTAKRLSFGAGKPAFDEDYNGNKWGGNRFWGSVGTFGRSYDRNISTKSNISLASTPPNFYPEQIYQSAIISTGVEPDLSFQLNLEVDPKQNYSIWFHFAEIDPNITAAGQRVFDILVNGDVLFTDVDIIHMTGASNAALVLDKAYEVTGKTLNITIHPKNGSHAIINAIEVFQVIPLEHRTSQEEVNALQNLKNTVRLPLRLGWNGDPCVPQQHPWSGVECQYDPKNQAWFIDGIVLGNQGLKGFLPNNIFNLSHLQKLNLSGNSIQGGIPYTIGTIAGLEILDLSYNMLGGSIPESLGQLEMLKILNLNENRLSGRVPSSLGGKLLHRASFNFTDNAGLCGIPGLHNCSSNLSPGAKVGISLASIAFLFLIVLGITCWWKRKENTALSQKMAAASREAPYARLKTGFNRDFRMTTEHRGYYQHRSPERESRPLPWLQRS